MSDLNKSKIKILFVVNLEYCSPRIPALIKYLDKTKFEPIIICPPVPINYGLTFGPNKELFDLVDNGAVRIIQTGERVEPRISSESIVSKIRNKLSNNKLLFNISSYIYTQYDSVKNYPDKDINWKETALKEIRQLLDNENIDILFSSSSPVTMHIICSQIKKEFNSRDMKWVADFRDPWTQNHSYYYNSIRKYFERKLEARTMSNVDQVITTAHKCQELFSNNPVYSHALVTNVTNGYDPDYYVKQSKYIKNEKLTIRYIGNVYYKNQNPSLFFKALKELIDSQQILAEKICVEFYGPYLPWLQTLINKFELNDCVKQCGMIARENAYTLQQTSDLLLLFNWETKMSVPPYPIKLFEYFGARRLIIATGGDFNDPVNSMIFKTVSGHVCTNTNSIKNIIERYYEYMFGDNKEYHLKNYPWYYGDKKELEKYSYKSTTKEFEQVFNSFYPQ